MMMFQLDPRLQQDCFVIAQLPLCSVLLMNDCHYPWTILVPRVKGVREIIDLDESSQQRLWRESALLSRVMQSRYQPYKLNIAALGNVVAQLHLHHIARFENDLAWPAPVWGKVPAKAYPPQRQDEECFALQQLIEEMS